VKPDSDEHKRVILGRISGLYGISGWLKIFSYSRPRENIFSYDPWLIKQPTGTWLEQKVSAWKPHSKGLIAQFDGVNDRDGAQAFVGLDIAVSREQLPALAEDEFYWCDLMGLEVVNQAQDVLGTIVEIRETGANDVLVVLGQERYLIPLLKGSVIKQVDQEQGRMLVDWDGEYI
jgi:16S rRNA processing protein RimM